MLHPDDIQILCVQINVKKKKRVIMGIYRLPQSERSLFIDSLCRDFYNNRLENIVIMGDFNLEPTEEPIENLCVRYNLYNLVKEPVCFKVLPRCYDLLLTNKKQSFQNTLATTTVFF